MDFNNINGRKLIELLNSDELEDLRDEIYGYNFEFEEEYVHLKRFVIHFTIESDYIIKGNDIYIYDDGRVECILSEPYDSGGQYREIEDITKVYLERLLVDVRDNKIGVTLGEVESEKDTLNTSIKEMLETITELSSTDDMIKLRNLESDLKWTLKRFDNPRFLTI